MIVLRSGEEIGQIRKAGLIVAKVLARLKKEARPGVTTRQLDTIAEEEIARHNAHPAFKGYKGYPSTICASINEAVVHGIPSDRPLGDGDILSIDVGVRSGNFFADAAVTLSVGAVTDEASKLIKATEDSLRCGIEKAVAGNRLSDISAAVQSRAESDGFSVVRAFVGHGIGEKIHEEPEIPNFGSPGRGPRLEPGMILAIEPMVNAGTFEVEVLEDGWTAVTKDRRLSAHFEHTVAVTSGKPEILTAL